MSLLNCLAFLQLMGICHRDLKPGNILLDESKKNLILIDYGVSENVSEKLQKFNTTRIQMDLQGTRIYLSPEMEVGLINDKSIFKDKPIQS